MHPLLLEALFLAQTMDATLGVRIHMQHDASTSQPWHHLGIMNTSGPDRPAKCESNEFFFSKHKIHASILPGSATFRGQAAFLVGQKNPASQQVRRDGSDPGALPFTGKKRANKNSSHENVCVLYVFFLRNPHSGAISQ